MRAPRRLLPAALAALLLPGAGGGEPGGLLGYRCADGYAFSARAAAEFAEVHLDGRTVILPRARAASGTRFAAGGVTFWPWREEARLETPEAARAGCRLQGPLQEEAPRRGWPREAAGVLDRFAGTWNTEITLGAKRGTGRGEGRWALGGRYFVFGTAGTDGTEEVQVMTWDPRAGGYRQWVFDSDGYRHEAAGRWDAATATLLWKGDGFEIEDRWTAPGRLQWTLRRAGGTAIEGVLLRIAR